MSLVKTIPLQKEFAKAYHRFESDPDFKINRNMAREITVKTGKRSGGTVPRKKIKKAVEKVFSENEKGPSFISRRAANKLMFIGEMFNDDGSSRWKITVYQGAEEEFYVNKDDDGFFLRPLAKGKTFRKAMKNFLKTEAKMYEEKMKGHTTYGC